MTATSRPSVEELLPLTSAVLYIELALAGESRHGYGIMKAVEEITGGKVTMGPGTLYGTIKRMLKARLIEEIDEPPTPVVDDERRRYYQLTSFGRQVLKAEVQRMNGLMRVARAKNLLEEPA